ncbi:hypothetical protein FM076_26825 [Streptomyces albus subsp. chlorinus]|uniref:hypothetical protein n=1 Tax=Streptomyces albus TaxID=1888 RepID=UPI0015707450|nr:hypothetical protein [Streptomyces albus]NSC24572.1 hypothetical protein [Streptomyces albus subsp. chlorinus]
MPHTDDTPRSHETRERPPHRPRHRFLVLAVVVLLIALPAGYLVQSAFQSRASGKDKERAAAATGLVYNRPPKVSQRIYDVPVPLSATRVAFYETNAWQKSTMWVEFRSDRKRLQEFLDDIGTGRLEKGEVAVTEKMATEVGWRFDEPRGHYWSTVHKQPGSQPDLTITVDKTYPARPHVYVVSTARF